MKATDFRAIIDKRPTHGVIIGENSNGDQIEITREQLRDMNIFDVKSVSTDNQDRHTLCDFQGNRMRVANPNLYQFAYGFTIRRISFKPESKPEVDGLGDLPLSAPIGVIYDINGNIITVEQARVQ